MRLNSISKFLSVSILGALLLSGCSSMSLPWSDSKTGNECPVVGITPDLGNITQFRGTDIVSETIIANVAPTCTRDDKAVTVRLAIDFKGRLGPAGMKDAATEANYSIPYLVAVLDPKGEIISKDIFAINLTYSKGQTEQGVPDLLEQIIPLSKGQKPGDYKIMLGFQLSEQELAFNRALAAQKAEK